MTRTAAHRVARERLAPVAFIGAGILVLTGALFPPEAIRPTTGSSSSSPSTRPASGSFSSPCLIAILACAVVALRERRLL